MYKAINSPSSIIEQAANKELFLNGVKLVALTYGLKFGDAVFNCYLMAHGAPCPNREIKKAAWVGFNGVK